MTKEVWKDIFDYKGLYQISNLGMVKSLGGRNGCIKEDRILKSAKDGGGYLHVILHKNGKRTTKKIHTLVWETFNGKIPKGLQVNHIDLNKLNNVLSNLELLNNRENTTHYCLSRKTSSQYTGVFKQNNKWRAQISINGKNKHLGLFSNEIDAHKAYQDALKKIKIND